MTTEEHLNRIVAKCRELLAIAEKRTPGKWGIEQTKNNNWIGPMRKNGDGKISIIVCETDRDGLRAECIKENDADALFVASCAGPAESGWRATIAAIESARILISEGGPEGNAGDFILNQIKAAWPEELL